MNYFAYLWGTSGRNSASYTGDLGLNSQFGERQMSVAYFVVYLKTSK